jgi:hypothetical protein
MGMMLPPGTVLAYDGSWAHRRGADQCFGALFAITPDLGDPANGKVVVYEVVQRQFRQQRHANYLGSATQSLQAMEPEALRRVIPRWKDNPNIVGFAHDQDAHASALIGRVDER